MEAVKGKIAVQGTKGTNAQHTINEDERRSFTDHINAVSTGSNACTNPVYIADDLNYVSSRRFFLVMPISVTCYRSRPTPCSCLTNAEVSFTRAVSLKNSCKLTVNPSHSQTV
jgi:hypothetical protein